MESVLELLGRRWAMRIVWELRRDRLGFGDLQRRLGVSPSVLSARLADLTEAGVCETESEGRRYCLTGRGRDLARVLFELNRWANADSLEPGASMLDR